MLREKAYAKINLCLDVVGKREDGYHDLKMIMVPIDFYDVLQMELAPETTMTLNRRYLPINGKNTVIKAIQVMKERYGIVENFACTLQKHIPTQAGLAGGSADAAAAIRILNRFKHLNMTNEELIDVAKEVGADVPFCIFNRPAYVEGIGDKLNHFDCDTDFHILLVKPHKGISTKAAFSELDFNQIKHPDCLSMKDALMNNDYEGIVKNLGNSLESVSLKLVSEIRIVKEDLLAYGFDGVLMSGSGSTVFGITKSPKVLDKAADLMRYKGYFVRKTKILNTGRG